MTDNEIDSFLARQAMGWTDGGEVWVKVEPSQYRWSSVDQTITTNIPKRDWAPSRDIEQALSVVDAIQRRFPYVRFELSGGDRYRPDNSRFTLTDAADQPALPWRAILTEDGDSVGSAYHARRAMAVCLAVVQAFDGRLSHNCSLAANAGLN